LSKQKGFHGLKHFKDHRYILFIKVVNN